MPQPMYKDGLFRNYFNNPKRLLSLCNALLSTDATDPGEVQINTLEGIFYAKRKNDLSCLFRGQFLVLTEHQSTINENMPLRCLFYVSELLKKIVEPVKDKIFLETLIKLPKPRFYVFYNGDKYEQARRRMRLSDAFDGDKTLELTVEVININSGTNNKFIAKSRYLQDYCKFVNRVKSNISNGMKRETALWEATEYADKNGIMMDDNYIIEKRKEIFDMYWFEWDEEGYEKALREDAMQRGMQQGLQQGMQQGLQQGMQQGLQQGENRMGQLISYLLRDGKTDEMQQAATNAARRMELYREYGIA